MKLVPLSGRMVVQVVASEEKTPGGLVLPDVAKEKPQRGKVVAIGGPRRLENGETVPMEVAEGDVVLFQKYGGNQVKFGKDEFLVLREDDVLAIVK